MTNMFLAAQTLYLSHLLGEARLDKRSTVRLLVYVETRVKWTEESEPVPVNFVEKGFIEMPGRVLVSASLNPNADAGMTVLLSVSAGACPDLTIADNTITGSITVNQVPCSFRVPVEFVAAVIVNDFGVVFDASLYQSSLYTKLSTESETKQSEPVKQRPMLSVVK